MNEMSYAHTAKQCKHRRLSVKQINELICLIIIAIAWKSEGYGWGGDDKCLGIKCVSEEFQYK